MCFCDSTLKQQPFLKMTNFYSPSDMTTLLLMANEKNFWIGKTFHLSSPIDFTYLFPYLNKK